MAPNTEFEIHCQCERLIYRFLQLLEDEQAKTADLFTEDAQAFQHVGRDKIREHFGAIAAVDHNVNVVQSSNLLVDVHGEDHASATNYVTHYVADRVAEDLRGPNDATVSGELDTPRSITRWSWEFQRVEGEWLISKLVYPESVLLRKDVIDEYFRQSR